MTMILNEELYAKNLLLGKNKDVRSAIEKIGYITRYHMHVLNKDDDVNYSDTVSWMQKHQDNFVESFYSSAISKAIKSAKKRPFFHVDSIKITKSELDKIKSLDNLRAEKILFVLLCMAKQQAISMGFTDGLVRYKLTDVCRMARISVPAEDREYILYNILKAGLLECPKKNNTECLWVKFIDSKDDVELNLNEADCKELAYVYLKWRGESKFKRCTSCGRLMQSKNSGDKCTYCEHSNVDDRQIWCIDCGKEIEISKFDNETCRCGNCNSIYQRQRNAKKNKIYRDKNKNKS